jgi:NTP pyrophosphatase (non-canonical NTP hydrolase)
MNEISRNLVLISYQCAAEVNRAEEKHPPMNSLHEGYAVILEELDEVWDEIKKKTPDLHRIRNELIQTAAMCIRLIDNVVTRPMERHIDDQVQILASAASAAVRAHKAAEYERQLLIKPEN